VISRSTARLTLSISDTPLSGGGSSSLSTAVRVTPLGPRRRGASTASVAPSFAAASGSAKTDASACTARGCSGTDVLFGASATQAAAPSTDAFARGDVVGPARRAVAFPDAGVLATDVSDANFLDAGFLVAGVLDAGILDADVPVPDSLDAEILGVTALSALALGALSSTRLVVSRLAPLGGAVLADLLAVLVLRASTRATRSRASVSEGSVRIASSTGLAHTASVASRAATGPAVARRADRAAGLAAAGWERVLGMREVRCLPAHDEAG
jgi:hypothetical protein